jgi:hypothetical protein
MGGESHPHKTVQLTITTRVPEWARWYAVDEDGSIRVFKFKPQVVEDAVWNSDKDEDAGLSCLGCTVLSAYGDIQGDGIEDHAPDWVPNEQAKYWSEHPRVKNWRELVFPIRKTDFR